MHVFVAGGAGYVGSRLVPELLAKGHQVTVFDLYLYGEEIFESCKNHPQLFQIKADLRDLTAVEKALAGCNAVIHLACISNDPSFALDPILGKSINLDCFEPFVQIAKKQGIKRFIYASSSSVYGVKQEPEVTEEMSLEPLTDYSRFKAECEAILLKYSSSEFITTVLRPATVCGYAPRQRLDVVVNLLTSLAYHSGTITIMGGQQMRPNIHIEDMVRAYLWVLDSAPELIQGKTFNVGYQNRTVLELGEMIQEIVSKKRSVKLTTHPTDDLRSYRVSSDKMSRELGFQPMFSIEHAIESLISAFQDGLLPDALGAARYYNIQTMKAAQLQ